LEKRVREKWRREEREAREREEREREERVRERGEGNISPGFFHFLSDLCLCAY
jgi:hypothetical protein